ncbi:hypothetical protein [Streptomyces sp. NRRL F-5650]|uniref:hypothetical protein n=1 Tax=Streptomyces sp. NRRL F-5650 TaxID=1463868 RepID=UPI0004C624E2|nr:hypothetical protein [Streptomyces sp. NRRL F-5650]
MTDALPPPRTTWEYCLSAADELVLWHMRQGGNVPEAERPRVVTLIGAAAYGLASSISLDGPDIAGLPLTGPDESSSASLRGVLQHHALRALQRSPYEVLGAAEREQLLAAYGNPAFDIAREAAVAVITHHARSSAETGQPHPTIRDRAPAMVGTRAVRARVDVEEARSHQQFLKAAGVIWVVYDGGLSRLPVVCTRCQARVGLTLQADAEARSVYVICPDRHTTQDHRLTITGVQEAIALGGASRVGDIEINTEATA